MTEVTDALVSQLAAKGEDAREIVLSRDWAGWSIYITVGTQGVRKRLDQVTSLGIDNTVNQLEGRGDRVWAV